MATWRRKLVYLFPEKRKEIETEYSSLYLFYLDFLPLTHEAHEKNDENFLKKIYGFSEWCCNQEAKDLWNPAGVSFYEHLFDIKRIYWEDVISWLSDDVIDMHKGLWEMFLEEDCYQDLVSLLNQRTSFDAQNKLSFSHPNIFTTGDIFEL